MIVEKNSSINNSLGISATCKYLLTVETENDFDELKDFLINKIKVLNHKWLIADFSDGAERSILYVGLP